MSDVQRPSVCGPGCIDTCLAEHCRIVCKYGRDHDERYEAARRLEQAWLTGDADATEDTVHG